MAGIRNAIVAAGLIFIIFAAGCTGTNTNKNAIPGQDNKIPEGPGTWAVSKCTDVCRQSLNEGRNISSGPCLSNEIEKDWVCDVAHSPRQDVDNLPENQCLAYRGGAAHHFVEVDGNCGLIRAV